MLRSRIKNRICVNFHDTCRYSAIKVRRNIHKPVKLYEHCSLQRLFVVIGSCCDLDLALPTRAAVEKLLLGQRDCGALFIVLNGRDEGRSKRPLLMLLKMARSIGDEKRQQSRFLVKASSLDLRRAIR
jgi:hypothetical protein